MNIKYNQPEWEKKFGFAPKDTPESPSSVESWEKPTNNTKEN